MTRIEALQFERNRLIEQLKYLPASKKAKILVQIMDIEDDIYDTKKNLEGRRLQQRFSF